jgi:hypothetical protein
MDLRSVLSRHNVDWRDRGANTSQGWVNIQCPLCRDDPSFHCRVDENLVGFYCLRNVRHKGSIHFLFRVLKISTKDLPVNLNNFNTPIKEVKEVDLSQQAFFRTAEESLEILNYLEFRKFSLPKQAVRKFNLQFSPFGKWAGRLLIPLTVGWTGRSIRQWIEPRYLANTNESGFFKYGRGYTAVVVEGPIDAMKLAVASEQFLFCATAGGAVSYALICYLRDVGIKTIHSVPDNNVDVLQRAALLNELRSGCPFATVHRTFLPEKFKDAGEMAEYEAKEWLYSL